MCEKHEASATLHTTLVGIKCTNFKSVNSDKRCGNDLNLQSSNYLQVLMTSI